MKPQIQPKNFEIIASAWARLIISRGEHITASTFLDYAHVCNEIINREKMYIAKLVAKQLNYEIIPIAPFVKPLPTVPQIKIKNVKYVFKKI